MLKILTILLAAACVLSATAQKSPDDMVKEFFDTYSKGKVGEAVDQIYSHSSWIQEKGSDDVTNLRLKIQSFAAVAGNYRGYTLLGTSSLLSDLVIYDYMVKYDRQPIRFRFEFYRADKEWSVFSFSFDDDLDDELEQMVKRTYFTP